MAAEGRLDIDLNSRCGIADYWKALAAKFPNGWWFCQSQRSALQPDPAFVVRCWEQG
jgi:hypothetical protein